MQTGFLSAFTSLNPKSERALPGGAEVRGSTLKLSHLWIKLLVNLSFSSDGQQMIIKQPGNTPVLTLCCVWYICVRWIALN